MNIYEATQAILEEAVPTANVSAFILKYDTEKQQYILPDFPAVTWNYTGITPIVTHDGDTDLKRVVLEVEVWGNLEQIENNADAVAEGINAQRLIVENVVFTLVMTESTDIMEIGLDFKRRRMRFSGLIEVGDEKDDSR